VEPLTKLSKMVGMKNVKENMVNQIVFFLQGFDKKDKCGECMNCINKRPCTVKDENLKHVVIYGGPGIGKTELGKILAGVYKGMGLLSKGNFVVANRSDLVGEYLGHTAAKTDRFFRGTKLTTGGRKDGNIGNVVFLDEFYQFADTEHRDSFSKECLDMINQILTEEKDLLVIVAGYKDAIEKCIFPVNQGLARRFPFVYELEKYTSEELKEIFLLKINNCGWKINMDMKKLSEFFSDNLSNFPFFGGDVETFLLKCKIVHGKRIFHDQSQKKVLTEGDINKGFEIFKTHRVSEATDMNNLDYDGIYMLEE
jgi:SpoVK/Ycf46/Vps4 family AAA+-type ATPase